MKRSWIFIWSVAMGASTGDRADGHLRTARIVPALEASHTHHKNYPDDGRPDIKMLKDKGFHDFSLPFPSVQSSSNFDKDYVKDENNDNGEWQAQADYDRLKGKLEKGNKALAVAKKRQAVEKTEVEKLVAKVDELKKKTGAAKLTAEKKHKARQALEQEEKAAWEKFVKAREAAGNMSWSKVPTDPVDKAKFMLKKEEIEFERCKEELEAAQKKLEAAQKVYDHDVAEQKRLGAQLKVKLNKEAEDEDDQAKKVEARGLAEQKEAGVAAKVENDAVKKAAEAHTQAQVEKSKLDSVGDAVSIAKEKVKKAESDLQKAECALRRFRNEKPCEDEHDAHSAKKSDTEAIKMSLAVLLPVLFAIIA